MNCQIIFVTSEAAPLVKTGGLADVCGSLPIELNQIGYETGIVLPWYDSIDGEILDTELVPLSGREIKVTYGRTQIEDVPVLLIGHPPSFKRDNLYDRNGEPYPDNDRRFILFSKAALRGAEAFYDPELYHCHDWFTGAVPLLLNHHDDVTNRPSIFTVHNLQHQGVFPSDAFRYLGLSWDLFRSDTVKFHDQLNLMKAGITQADQLTTVSPTYSQEIQTPEFGEGLEETLAKRSGDLNGVLNGIDPAVWDPTADQYLDESEQYDSDDLSGKQTVRTQLTDDHDLPIEENEPLVGMIGRLVNQKGFDLVLDAWEKLAELPGRWIVLGTGEPALEDRLRNLHSRFPDKIHPIISFNERLAHRIEAGADLFCMPSRYEPCGLNQMYSMQYGTVPIVHRVGGLADTVTDPADDDTPTGFVFDEFSTEGLVNTVRRATEYYQSKPDEWATIRNNGMTRDWSWSSSASKYATIYEDVLS